LFLLFASFQAVNSYKILVYNSKFGHSHSNYLGQIADILAEAGHNVTSLLPILDPAVRDCTEKSHKIHVQPDPIVKETSVFLHTEKILLRTGIQVGPPTNVGPMFADIFSRTCKRVIGEPGLLEKLREEKFDVMIGENFDVCGMGISKFIAPKAMIGVSTTCLFGWQFPEFGIPQALSYQSTPFMSSLNVHSAYERFLNFYASCLIRLRFVFSRRSVNQALKEHFGDDYPTVAEQSANVAYLLTNSEPLLDYAAPTMSRVIDVPGIGAKQPKALDKYWTEILTRRENSILLSFGSVVKSILIPENMKKAILTTIARFPDVTFIWKYEEPEDDFCKEHASKVPNLVMTKWMPQVDILAHPRLAVFITHGGMGSTQETALRGVPGIFIPVFGDQPRNAGMMEYNGLGKVFSKFDLGDADKLTVTVREVLENKKYRENARRISKMLAKKPFSSKEQLVRHVEFAAEFGASAALRPQSLDMSFIEYHNLDLLLIVSNFIAICFFLIVKTVIFVFRILTRGRKSKTE
ncbi:hypothetical protein PFISCL1PPCAC_7251, partial [Pristionchus fissidentatus]